MHNAVVTLESLSLYSQSRPHNTPRLDKESPSDWEGRIWHMRLHTDKEGVVIPAMAFKNCLAEAAKFLNLPLPDNKRRTFTKHFEAGVLVTEPSPLFYPEENQKSSSLKRILPPSDEGLECARLRNAPTTSQEEQEFLDSFEAPPHEAWGDWIFTPSDGVPGGGKRVWKCYPMITKWTCQVNFRILDDTITEDVFRKVLEQAGFLIGLGRFRVRNRGTYGQFKITGLNWQKTG